MYKKRIPKLLVKKMKRFFIASEFEPSCFSYWCWGADLLVENEVSNLTQKEKMPGESLACFLPIFKSANHFKSSLMTCYFGKVQ